MMYKPTSVEDYFSRLPKEQVKILQKLRKKIKTLVPEAVETISYGMPAYKYKGKPLIYYAVFKDHFSIFPNPSPIGKLSKELEPYKVAKGTIQYPLGTEFSEDLLKKILMVRVEDIETSPTKSAY